MALSSKRGDDDGYRLCWPRLAWIRELGSLVNPGSGRLIGVQVLWRRNREFDDAF